MILLRWLCAQGAKLREDHTINAESTRAGVPGAPNAMPAPLRRRVSERQCSVGVEHFVEAAVDAAQILPPGHSCGMNSAGRSGSS